MKRVLLALMAGLALASHAATPMVSAGDQHSVALHRDGSLRAWGDDQAGALGTGRSLRSLVPIVVSGLENVVAVAASGEHTLALTSDGRVWAWGRNEYGQLGDGTRTGRSTPGLVPNLTGVVEIGAGTIHSVVRKSDGTVWTWGANFAGALGTASDLQLEPAQVPGLSGVISIASGPEHVAAITSDRRIWMWGRNDSGQLGDGARTAQYTGRHVPTPVASFTNALAVAIGDYHTLALRQDGTVWAWGDNEGGRLGDGTTTSRSSPVQVQSLGSVALIAAGYYSVAVRTDGSLWAWGPNGYGQLGDDTYTDRPLPVPINLTNVVAVSIASIHTSAVRSDGTVWSWGSNERGELGDGTADVRNKPVQVAVLSNVTRVAKGSYHGVALRSDGRVWTWGDDSSGQLGQGTRVFRTTPTTPVNATGFTQVSAGGRFSAGLKADGRVHVAGNNDFGQLGDGTRSSRAVFGLVPGLTDVAQISAGFYHTLARRTDGTVWAFGGTYRGRLGAGENFDNELRPIRVSNLTNVTSVSAGGGHSLALRSDGTVWAWGENTFGQVGDGTTADRYVPVQVPGLTGVVEIAAGVEHSLARKSDGSVWAWGRNYSGQLGDDSNVDRHAPVRVIGLLNATQVSAGNSTSGALTADGSVWMWGANYDGQLGDGTIDERPYPFRLPSLPGVRAISVGGSHTLALRSDGTVFVWGRNDYGQVGDGTLASRWSAVVATREGGGGSVAANDWFLDLDPEAANNVPPERVPVFLVTTTAAPNDVVANVQLGALPGGTTAEVYVFALAPPNRVAGSVAQKSARFGALEKGEKNTSVQCVLAQLSRSGQLQAVSAANLQAYVSGVTSGQSQAVSVLGGAPTANIGGATFFVGYGSNPSAMLNNGTNRGVLSVPGTTECTPQPPQTGWWWNAAEGGRGYSIEARGNHIFYAAYLYDASGRASWLIATGNTSLDGALFTGDLYEFRGGQTLGGPPSPFPQSRTLGTITLAFNSASQATMIWPGGSVPIERFNIVPNGLDLPEREGQPEGGWWWNPDENGRGFFLEWQGGQLFMTGFMFDDAGNPIWYLSQDTSPRQNLRSYSGVWWQYGNGQTLTGPYRAPTRVNDNVAPVTIQFSGPETGIMTLPNGRTTAIRRFRF